MNVLLFQPQSVQHGSKKNIAGNEKLWTKKLREYYATNKNIDLSDAGKIYMSLTFIRLTPASIYTAQYFLAYLLLTDIVILSLFR